MDISKVVDNLPHLFKRQKIVKLLLFFSPKSHIQLVRFNGSARLFADIYDPGARVYFLTKSFEPEFFLIAKSFLSRGGVFFDIGANFGFCSFGMIACLPQTVIEYHLFEADSYVCELLRKSKMLYPDIDIFINNYCVTDKNGVSRLYITKPSFSRSFISDEGTQEVRNILLDEYIKKMSIKKVNFLKIDIEGWEPMALKGGYNSLASGIIEAIYIEISSTNLARSGFSVMDCIAPLRQKGFRIFYVKSADFESGIAQKNKTFIIYVNGYPLKVAELNAFPEYNYQTDVLAIHESSDFL